MSKNGVVKRMNAKREFYNSLNKCYDENPDWVENWIDKQIENPKWAHKWLKMKKDRIKREKKKSNN